jgi:8-oxo-dGTP diphosphatase
VPARTLVVAAALLKPGRVLAARRIDPAGTWEFPGGKCEAGEEPLAALQRELTEELGIRAVIGTEIVSTTGVWPINDRLVMRIWYATPLGEPRCRGDHDALAWLAPAELADLDWLPADVPIAARIAEELRDGVPLDATCR